MSIKNEFKKTQIFMKKGGYNYEGKTFETIVSILETIILVLINSNYF